MKVILLADVKGIGNKGEVKDVREGYGRNFLIPRGLAIPLDKSSMKKFDALKKRLEEKKERQQRHLEKIKEKLEGTSVLIRKKVGREGRLFGSVTEKDITSEIKKSTGIEIDKKDVRIEEPLKMVGVYNVKIHLGKDVDANVKVEITGIE